jgi:carbon-monoxide dehydrogenase small subunit
MTTPRPIAKAATAPRLLPVRLTVNGEVSDVLVSPRTQLAEILRDHLNLTATHLACEQGVCGACTVFVDGRPVRSCLTFAADCEGAAVETLEGWKEDKWMDRLRAAFTRNHALQCGFCTPGMLATARDLVVRLDTADETRIRNELSGNLCRCTGYMGIVASIREVIEQRNAEANAPAVAAIAHPQPERAGFTAFEPRAEAEIVAAAAPKGQTRSEGGWTVVRRNVTLAHPIEAVWAHFKNLSAVATCLPGAELTEIEGDRFAGHVGVRFGPIAARFEGEGQFTIEEPRHKGLVTGRGKDRAGQSNVEGQLGFAVTEGNPTGASDVDVSFRFKIEGRLGQFNRPELVNGLVDYILGEFVANCNAVLAGGTVRNSKGVSLLALLRAVLVGFFRRS